MSDPTLPLIDGSYGKPRTYDLPGQCLTCGQRFNVRRCKGDKPPLSVDCPNCECTEYSWRDLNAILAQPAAPAEGLDHCEKCGATIYLPLRGDHDYGITTRHACQPAAQSDPVEKPTGFAAPAEGLELPDGWALTITYHPAPENRWIASAWNFHGGVSKGNVNGFGRTEGEARDALRAALEANHE